MSYQLIDLAKWNRGEHFKFYQNASQPWFNIVSDVGCNAIDGDV